MLKLVKCEFLKLKRKKFIPLVILAAFLFPIPLTYLMTTPSMMERYVDKADAFDGLFNMVLGYGIQFLLPCLIGVIAAMLFFMERDNDTFKNLRTIPVTSTQMVLAKILVLFFFGIVFCVASTIVTILCGFGTLEVYGIWYKLFLAVETGIFITAGTLPLIVLVVFFSKTYVFSILLCVFYSVLNMSASLIAGYMISREQTDDTLKNILTVPVSFKRLLTGKLIVCGVLSIVFGLICSLFTIIAELIVGFPGFHFSLILQAVLQITAANFFLYLAVLPIIIITSRKSGSFLIGVIVAFVYGYGGMFAAGNMTLANIYPITASLGMIHYRSYDAAVSWNLVTCTVSLAIVVAISAGLILCMKEKEPKQVKKKAKKVAPKKGW